MLKSPRHIESSPDTTGSYATYSMYSTDRVLTIQIEETLQNSLHTLSAPVEAASVNTTSDANALPQTNPRSLDHLDKLEFGASQLAKHTFIFLSLIATALMAWFLAVLFQDVGVSYSLSTLISIFPAAALVGAPLALFIYMFLMTNIVDALPSPSLCRSAFFWAVLVGVGGILGSIVAIAWKWSDVMDRFVLHAIYIERQNTSDIGVYLSPNLYVICFTISISMFTMLVATGMNLYALRFRSVS